MIIAIKVVILLLLIIIIIIIIITNNNIDNNGTVSLQSSHLIEEMLFKIMLKSI